MNPPPFTLTCLVFSMVRSVLAFLLGILVCWRWRKERDSLNYQCHQEFVSRQRLKKINTTQGKYLHKIGAENKKLGQIIKYKDDQLHHLAQIFYQLLKSAEAGLKMQTNRAETLRMIVDSIKPMFPDEQPPTRGKKQSNLNALKQAEDRIKAEKAPPQEESKKTKTQAAVNQAKFGAIDLDPQRKIK